MMMSDCVVYINRLGDRVLKTIHGSRTTEHLKTSVKYSERAVAVMTVRCRDCSGNRKAAVIAVKGWVDRFSEAITAKWETLQETTP